MGQAFSLPDFCHGLLGVIEDGSLAPVVWQAAGTMKARLRRVSLADCFAIELAERLGALAPPGLDRVFLVNSGSEACDTALKIALAY